jgi:glycosyltransferase involved in cell wall biosynthesis
MRKILITAYAVNPYKGSEEGTGWNLICQVAQENQVVAVTRKNNEPDIRKYIDTSSESKPFMQQIEFLYFDLPKWMIWWKKGPLLSALYFYIWQFGVAIWLRSKNISFDIAHSLNFHSNWTPSFLWILGKPFVWGPVGNHPLIPKQYLLPVYGKKAFLKDRLLWAVKLLFWNIDPFVWVCKTKARKVFCVNFQAGEKLRLEHKKIVFMPAVASETPNAQPAAYNQKFKVLSVGRFVPLKGFDLAIRAFAKFYHALPALMQAKTEFLIIGKGPDKKLMVRLISELKLEQAVTIRDWMPRTQVIDEFRTASVFLFPSHEGAGMVVPEAMSYGVPVICLDNYGPGEYIHPASRLRVPQNNYEQTVDAISGKLDALAIDQVYMKHEKQLAYERFTDMFRWSVKKDLMNKVYDEIGINDSSAETKTLLHYAG